MIKRLGYNYASGLACEKCVDCHLFYTKDDFIEHFDECYAGEVKFLAIADTIADTIESGKQPMKIDKPTTITSEQLVDELQKVSISDKGGNASTDDNDEDKGEANVAQEEQGDEIMQHEKANTQLKLQEKSCHEESIGLAIESGWVNIDGGVNEYGVDQGIFCYGSTMPRGDKVHPCYDCYLHYSYLYFCAHIDECYDGTRRVLSDPKYDRAHEPVIHSLLNSETANTAPGELNCQVKDCDYSSDEFYKFEEHQRRHTRETPFKCPHCENGKFFQTVADICEHILQCHSDIDVYTIYTCDFGNDSAGICERRFLTDGELKIHQGYCPFKGYNPEKPYACNFVACKESFLTQTQLTSHQGTCMFKSFPTVKLHACDNERCAASFHQSNDLKRHKGTCTL